MEFAQLSYQVFEEVVSTYHVIDNVDAKVNNPYSKEDIKYTLFEKCWIDTVQWHLEDVIRDPEINPEYALTIKRRIDISNQCRTDLVEELDTHFLTLFNHIEYSSDATINTESPAWAIDRLSILALKIYHMEYEVKRGDATQEHTTRCNKKLQVLLEQKKDLITAIDQLLYDISNGKKYMKVYRQMKMYNDVNTNPILYKSQK